jgi:hypothetical protein
LGPREVVCSKKIEDENSRDIDPLICFGTRMCQIGLIMIIFLFKNHYTAKTRRHFEVDGLIKTALKICKVVNFLYPNRDVRVLMGSIARPKQVFLLA